MLNAKLCIEIENYLSEYCSESLQRFSLIVKKSKIPFEHLQKPLKKVNFLKIIMMTDQEQHHIQFLNEINLPNVQYLYITNNNYSLQYSEKKVHYENIKSFTLRTFPMSKLPFSFGNLNHFVLAGNTSINDELIEFISNNKHLTTLSIMLMEYIASQQSFDKILELQNVQSNLEELQLECTNLLPDDIVRFIKQCKKLRKLTIHSSKKWGRTSFLAKALLEIIPSRLGVAWKLYTIDPYINPFDFFIEHECFVIERIID